MSALPHDNAGTSIPTSVIEGRHETVFRRSHQHSSLPQPQQAEQQINVSFHNNSNHSPFMPSPLLSQHHHSRPEHQQQNQHQNINFMPEMSPVANMMEGMDVVGDPSQFGHLQNIHVHRYGQNLLEKNRRQSTTLPSTSASLLLTSPIKRKSRNHMSKMQINRRDLHNVNMNSINAAIPNSERHEFAASDRICSAKINAVSVKQNSSSTNIGKKNQSIVTPSSMPKYVKKHIFKISENDVISGPKFRKAIKKQKGNKLFCKLVTDCGGKLVQVENDELARNEDAAPVYLKEATAYIQNKIKDTQPPGRFLKFDGMRSFEDVKVEVYHEAREDFGQQPAYLDAKSFSIYHSNNQEIPIFTELSTTESSKKIGAAIRDKRNQLKKNEKNGIEPIETKTKLRVRKPIKVEKDISLRPQSQLQQIYDQLPAHDPLMPSNLSARDNNEPPLFNLSTVDNHIVKDEFNVQQPFATPVLSPFSQTQSATSVANSFNFSSPSIFNSKNNNEVFSYSPLYNNHQTKFTGNGIDKTNEFCNQLNLSSILKQRAQNVKDNIDPLEQDLINDSVSASIELEKSHDLHRDQSKKRSASVAQRSKKRNKDDKESGDPSHHRLCENVRRLELFQLKIFCFFHCIISPACFFSLISTRL